MINVQINTERGFAFLEFRSLEECTNCLAFDGIMFGGSALKIKRPKDYVPPTNAPEQVGGGIMFPDALSLICLFPSQAVPRVALPGGTISTNVPNGPNKIYIGGLPTYMGEPELVELLQAFGALKGLNVAIDNQGGDIVCAG